MSRDQFGFLVHPLEELQAHLKDELARNPFINSSRGNTAPPESDDPPPPRDGPEPPGG